jgi:hypothetical protein
LKLDIHTDTQSLLLKTTGCLLNSKNSLIKNLNLVQKRVIFKIIIHTTITRILTVWNIYRQIAEIRVLPNDSNYPDSPKRNRC